MATVFPNPNLQPSPQKPEASQQQGQRYQNRVYQPYVFQPNFLKQQIRQRELEKAAHLGQLGDATPAIQLTLRDRSNASSHGFPQNTVDDLINNRKKSGRKVIDWTSSCAIYLERRKWQREFLDVPSLLPDPTFSIEMQSTMAYKDSSASSVATKFVRSATNKMKCPVYKVVWTPDGRRLVTGSASGEFTLWNGTAFNFETILQAHDSPVRAMSWSRNDAWLITGDNLGYIKYWQLNMNNVKMYQAHKDQACRSVCFGPTDAKFVTGSDDGTVRVWDFLRCNEEHILRGHGSDVKQVDWHPQKSLIASASKDLQTPVKLWDPRTGQSLCTVHAHKGTVMDIKFNRNGNWFLTASRDHLIKLFDIRNLKEERQVFRGHKKEAFSVAWHPIHEDMFASGGSEGSIMFWQVGEDKEIGGLEGAHDSLIWSLAWHPLGHILVSGSNDHSTKFWTRNRPGDQMKDRYNLFPGVDDVTVSKTATATSTHKAAEVTNIPGMGDADVAAAEVAKREEEQLKTGIPGLDWSFEEKNEFERKINSQNDNRKKIPYARPVPRSFAAAWESNKEGAPRRHSRSPSPPRYDEPHPGWRRDHPPSRMFHPHHGRDPRPPPEDFPIIEDRRPMMDFEPNHHPRPPHEEKLPPNHMLQSEPHRPPPRDMGPNSYVEGQDFHEPRQMREQIDNRPPFVEQNHLNPEFSNTQGYDGNYTAGVEHDEMNFPPERRDYMPGMRPREFEPLMGPDGAFHPQQRLPPDHMPKDHRRPHDHIPPQEHRHSQDHGRPPPPNRRMSQDHMPPQDHSMPQDHVAPQDRRPHPPHHMPQEMNEWNDNLPGPPNEPIYGSDGLSLNAEAYYDDLLSLDPALDETILANFDLQQEAKGYAANRGMHFPHNGPPRGMNHLRGPPRGRPPGRFLRGRGTFRGNFRFPPGQVERGRKMPPRMMKRGGRRPLMFD